MIQHFELTGLHLDVDTKLRIYTTKKLTRLDRYLPRHSRESARMEVRLKEVTFNGKRQYVCELALHIPQRTCIVAERGTSIHAAVDMASTCLKHQIHKYKDEFTSGKQHRHVFARFRQQFALNASIVPSN